MQKTVFISGAGQGIGAAIAQYFYQHGYLVGLYDLNVDQVQIVAAKLGPRARAGQLDVCSYASWQQSLATFNQWAGALNLLVNNAGILYSGPFEETDIAQHQRCIQTNVMGVINGCHAALPYLLEAQHARVINLSSSSALYGQADLASYSSSKFAVRGLTEALDTEWQKYKIRVLDVMPLFVKTNMIKGMRAASLGKIGANLSAQDVAKQVYKLAHYKDHIYCPTHHPVGFKSQLLYQLSTHSPQAMQRWFNLQLSKNPTHKPTQQ